MKALEDGVQTAVSKAVDKLCDHLRPPQEVRALNDKVETQIEGLTEKVKQVVKLGDSTDLCPESL